MCIPMITYDGRKTDKMVGKYIPDIIHAVGTSFSIQLIYPWTKLPPFRRRYFRMHFHE